MDLEVGECWRDLAVVLDLYTLDSGESGPESYDIAKLVEIPKELPEGTCWDDLFDCEKVDPVNLDSCESSPDERAMLVTLAVLRLEDARVAAGGRRRIADASGRAINCWNLLCTTSRFAIDDEMSDEQEWETLGRAVWLIDADEKTSDLWPMFFGNDNSNRPPQTANNYLIARVIFELAFKLQLIAENEAATSESKSNNRGRPSHNPSHVKRIRDELETLKQILGKQEKGRITKLQKFEHFAKLDDVDFLYTGIDPDDEHAVVDQIDKLSRSTVGDAK